MRRIAAVVLGAATACGGHVPVAPLPGAGTPDDDGSGQLARASTRMIVGDDATTTEALDGTLADDRPTNYQYDQYASWGYGGYGGGLYGDTGSYGGSLYANYQPYYSPTTTPPQAWMYVGGDVPTAGAIVGTVRWPSPPAAPAMLALPGCGDVPNATLAIGSGAALGGAIVYLEHVDHGRAWPVAARAVTIGGEVERRGCALWPTAQVVAPLPSMLTLINGDLESVALVTTPANPTAASTTPSSTTTPPPRIVLPAGGSQMMAAGEGELRVADDAGALVPAFIVGLTNPYYAITDAEGRFRLDDVPPGTYQLVVWHAPVVTGVKDGKPVYGASSIVRRDVVVKAIAATPVTVDLPPLR